MKLRPLITLLMPWRCPHFLRVIWWRFVLPRRVKWLGVRAARSVQFYGMPIISIEQGSRIEIGERTVICSNSAMTALGVNHPVVLRTLRSGAEILIGSNTGMSGGTICAATRVEIGNECLFGANVTIADTDFHALNPVGRRYNSNPLEIGAMPITIEDNVFIGTGTMVLKGVRIGKNSVVGAGSVVTKDVPPNSIAAGSPAKILRRL